MAIIYKYELKPDGWIVVPHGSKFLHARWKDESVKTWFEVPDPNSVEPSYEKIVAIPTGMIFNPQGLEYLDTIHIEGENLVFHLYKDRQLDRIEGPVAYA